MEGERQTDRQTDGQTDRQTGRQTDRQTYRQTDRQSDRQTDRRTDRRARRRLTSITRKTSDHMKYIPTLNYNNNVVLNRSDYIQDILCAVLTVFTDSLYLIYSELTSQHM